MAGIELDVAKYFQCLAGTENDLNHEPGELLVPFWVASSPIHFLKAQNFYFMKNYGGHVNEVA